MEVSGLLCKIGTNAKLWYHIPEDCVCVLHPKLYDDVCIVTNRLLLYITQNFLHRNTAMMCMAPLHGYFVLFQDNR